jgi:hypothetical protein
MIEQEPDGRYFVTPLGRLAGEGAIEVESVIRVVDCLDALQPEDIIDPVLLVAAQLTIELDAVPFPINKKSTQKEPQTWLGELRRQRVASAALGSLQRHAAEHVTATLRAKRAVACLYYVAGTEMNEIERVMTQFGGSFDGAAGPIRSVTSRTTDVLPMVARVGELLRTGLDLSSRAARLAVRLEYGVGADAVDLARFAGRDFGRGDYRRLSAAGLTTAAAINEANDDLVLRQVRDDRSKLRVLRMFAESVRLGEKDVSPVVLLQPYQA